MPRFLLAAGEDPNTSVVVPGIYASLLPWAEAEYTKSGDPRWLYCHADGEGRLCRGGDGCGHGEPPPDPTSERKRRLDALTAGEAVVVSTWFARGRRWQGVSWSEARFDLPWGREVRSVRVNSDDTVSTM